jgi:uncharacterized membrane protein
VCETSSLSECAMQQSVADVCAVVSLIMHARNAVDSEANRERKHVRILHCTFFSLHGLVALYIESC